MPKSKYPEKLDTSVELPAVRDSALSNEINSLRSAIIQIERTLGVNPQGTVGNTVSTRLSKALDGNGNILKSALTSAGILSGPISNNEVSNSAAISERKLNLDFPTQLLQDEISMLQADIELFDEQIAELSSKLSTHLSSFAINRHPGSAISLSPNSSTPSDSATLDLEANNVQTAFDNLYDQHINYTGLDIASDNNSHLANQIFFDNSNVSAIISSGNVQEAIETIVTLEDDETGIHQDIQHSNGLLRIGKLRDVSIEDISEILAEDIPISFSKSAGGADGTTDILMLEEVLLGDFSLRPFDFIKISDASDVDEIYSGIYEIRDFEESGGKLLSLNIFGALLANSTSTTLATIGKSTERRTNQSSLVLTSTEEATLTSSRYLSLANPDSVRVFTRNINSMGITSINRYISLKIDETSYDIDCYSTSAARQSIDSILTRINEQLVESAANAFAYRIDYEYGGSEISIVHTIPDEDGEEHTITITRGSDDAIDSMGLAYIEDIEIKAMYGSKYFIGGNVYSGLKTKVDTQNISFFAGSNLILSGESGVDFINSNIKNGDLVIISGSESDDGTFFIEDVSESQFRVISGQLPTGFSSSASEDVRIRIFSSVSSLEDITFDKVSGTFGSSLIDIFMDKNRDIYYSKVLEYSSVIYSSESLVDIVDIDGENFYDETITILAEEDPLDASAFYISVDGQEPIQIKGEYQYIWLATGTTTRIKVFIKSSSSIASKIAFDGASFSMEVFLLESANSETNLILGRALYNNFNGRVSGGINGTRIFSKLPIGNVGNKEISNEARRELVQTPLSELRYNGVIYGFEIENISLDSDNFYNFDLNRGVGYVNGRRIEKNSIESVVTDIDAISIDKIYIILNEDGVLRAESALPTDCSTPFGETDYVILASIEYDGVNLNYIDLRLFIDHLDLKLLNSISVSPERGMGHFIDPVRAINYAKRFSQIFPNAGTPIVHFKSGVHIVELDYSYSEDSTVWDPADISNIETFYDGQIASGFFIDFPVVIEGEGSETVLEFKNNSEFTDTSYQLVMPINIIGDGFNSATRGFNNLTNNDFVEIKNIKLKNTPISIVDMNLKDSLNVDLRYRINIDNVYFDFTNFAGNFIDGTNGPRAVQLLEVSDNVTNKGNVTINNCTFIRSGIYTDDISRTKNINITNNIIIDDDTTNFLFNDLYSFNTAGSGSNINIVNNKYTTNLNPNDGTGPEIVSGSVLGWGERFDRDIRVGNDGYFQSSTEIDGLHRYTNPKTKYLHYWAPELGWSGILGLSSAVLSEFQDSTTFPSIGAFFYQGFPPADTDETAIPYLESVAGEKARYFVRVPLGTRVTEISIIEALDPSNSLDPLTVSDIITVSLYNIKFLAGNTLNTSKSSPLTLLGSTTTQKDTIIINNLTPIRADFSSSPITIDDIDYSGHLVQIEHSSTRDLRLAAIRITVEIDNVEAGLSFNY